MVDAWLHAVNQRSRSLSVRVQYTRYMQAFRCDVLTPVGIDLDGDPALVATLLQGWAARPLLGNERAKASTIARQRRLESTGLAAATYNNRIAIIASFYRYVTKRGWIPNNPTNLIDRRSAQAHDYAYPMTQEEVQQALERIDRSTLSGKRDYAVLLLAFTTGRRKAELAALRWGDIILDRRGQMTVIWRHCKGDKQMEDELSSMTAAALLDNMHAIYGADLSTLGKDTPIWVSFYRNPRYWMAALRPASLRCIWQARLGTTKIHTSRHTFAVLMEQTGAKLTDIQHRLGHTNAAVTSDYLQRLRSAKNPFGEKLEQAIGASQSATPTGEKLITKEQRIQEAILAHPELSHHALAKLVGCHHATISRRRQVMGLSRPMESNQYTRPTSPHSTPVDKTSQHS